MHPAAGLVLTYLALATLPLAIAALPPRPPGRAFVVELAVALGFVGWAQVGLQFGLIARFRRISRPFGIDLVMQLHRQLGFVAVGFVLAHALLLPLLGGVLMGGLASLVYFADITWFRVGGPAQVLFAPADAADLAYFLAHIPAELPVTVIGLGSNLLVRDGGIPGVAIRLGRGFAQIAAEGGHRIRAGAAVPDVKLARAAAEAGIAGLAFYRGIPGAIGGAVRMNAGAHGGRTGSEILSGPAGSWSSASRMSLADSRVSCRRTRVRALTSPESNTGTWKDRRS